MIPHYDARQSIPAQVSLERGEDWRDEASCREQPIQYGWDPWYPESKPGHISTYTIARRICSGCPVRLACLDDAMDDEVKHAGERMGMRGGLTPDERYELADALGIRRKRRGAS